MELQGGSRIKRRGYEKLISKNALAKNQIRTQLYLSVKQQKGFGFRYTDRT